MCRLSFVQQPVGSIISGGDNEGVTNEQDVLLLLPVGLAYSLDPFLDLLLFWATWRQILNIASLTWVEWRHSWPRPAA